MAKRPTFSKRGRTTAVRWKRLWRHRFLGWHTDLPASATPSDLNRAVTIDRRWVARWLPRRGVAGPRCLWVWRDIGELAYAYPGDPHRPPPTRTRPFFCINGYKVYRDWCHPDGPSSVPCLVIRRRRAYPSEGMLEADRGRALYDVTGVPVEPKQSLARIRINPEFRGPAEPPSS